VPSVLAIAGPSIPASPIWLNALPEPTSTVSAAAAAVTLVAGDASATGRTAGASTVQVGGTDNAPIVLASPSLADTADADAEERVMALTDEGLGADVAIEAVGIPATFDICTRVVRPGGVIANVGVHGAPTTLHLEDLWIKNVTITTGLVDGTTVPMLLQLVRSGKIAADLFGTHDFALHDMMAAYDTFAEAGKHNALKVVIRR